MNVPSRIGHMVVAFFITGWAGIAGATLDISDAPLVIISAVEPNLLVALDDSGSMSFEIVVDGNDGSMWWDRGNATYSTDAGEFRFNGGDKASYLFPFTEGPGQNDHATVPPFIQYGYTRSAAFNKGYYDPNVDYQPWPAVPGETFDPADPESALSDPARSTGNSGRTLDLTDDGDDSTNNHYRFQMFLGMRIPEGTRFRINNNTGWDVACRDLTWGQINNNSCSGFNNIPGQGNENYIHIEADYSVYYVPVETGNYRFPALSSTFVGDCTVPFVGAFRAFEQFPSTLTSSDGVDALALDGTCLRRVDVDENDPEMQNFANWYSYYRKRHLAIRNGLIDSFKNIKTNLNAGLFTINDRQTPTMYDFLNGTGDERNSFLQNVANTNFGGGTPNRVAMTHGGLQFRRTNDPIIEHACQKNFQIFFTDGFSTLETPGQGFINNNDGDNGVPFADGQSDTIGDVAMYFYEDLDVYGGRLFSDDEKGKVPTPAQCRNSSNPERFDCNADLHVNTYVVTLNGKGTIYNQEVGGVFYDEVVDIYEHPFDWPNVGADRDPRQIDDLYHAALNGRGLMLNAATPEQLKSRFEEILKDIVAKSKPTSSLTAASTRITAGTKLFQAEFESENWTGNLFAIDLDGNVVWDAGALLNTRVNSGGAARNVFTHDGAEGVEFNGIGSLASDQQTEIRANLNAIFTVPAADQAQLEADFVDFVLGESDNEVRNGGDFRDRGFIDFQGEFNEVQLGDIVNSVPSVVAPANEGWVILPTDEGGGDAYRTFVNETKFSRSPTTSVLVGTNDGSVRAIDGESGREIFAYIPQTVVTGLPTLADPDYTHRFFVDGSPSVADAYDGSWKTVAVGTLGAGGRGVYALNVTNPDTFGADDVLWEFNSDDDSDLGFTIGQARVTRAGDGTWVAIFGNGYNSAGENGYLFVVDLFDGSLLTKIPTGVGNSAAPAGLGTPIFLTDLETAQHAELAYAGDLQGNLWKFDLSDDDPANWALASNTPLFVAQTSGGDRQAITSSPTLLLLPAGDIGVYFGTGKYFERSDNVVTNNTERETMYLVLDRLDGVSVSRSDLQPLVLQSADGDPNFRSVADATVDLSVSDGFYIDLFVSGQGRGERVLAAPQVRFGRLLFNTFQPVDDICTPGGVPRLYVLDALDGSNRFQTSADGSSGDPGDPNDPPDPDDPDSPNVGGRTLSAGSPTSPPILIDTFGDEDSDEVGRCINRSEVIAIDPVSQVRIPIACVTEGRAVWRQPEVDGP